MPAGLLSLIGMSKTLNSILVNDNKAITDLSYNYFKSIHEYFYCMMTAKVFSHPSFLVILLEKREMGAVMD